MTDESNEERRLLEAIAESPDDDAPRLVYADWLQSRGDPRGELIQLQCQLAAVPDDDRRRNIKIAENKLLAAHGADWIQPLHDLLPPPANTFMKHEFEFVRGFIEDVTITLQCLPYIEQLFARAPMLRRLRVTGNGLIETTPQPPRLERGLSAPSLARLRGLELWLPGGGNRLARDVADATHLRQLRELRIVGSVWGESANFFAASTESLVIDDAGVNLLAAAPHLATLEKLDLEANRVTTAGVHSIANAAWRLRELVLSHNAIDPTNLAAALGGPALAQLEVLALVQTTFEPPQIAALVSSPNLANLRELDLERCHLGVPGTTALCQAFALPALRRLRLERNSVCDAGAIAIASCAALANLTSFEAGHNRIGQKGATALATNPHFANLERLTLNEPRWKPEISALFADSPILANAKIYLGGRLVGRKKSKPGTRPTTAAPAPPAPAPLAATSTGTTTLRAAAASTSAGTTTGAPRTTESAPAAAKPTRKRSAAAATKPRRGKSSEATPTAKAKAKTRSKS